MYFSQLRQAYQLSSSLPDNFSVDSTYQISLIYVKMVYKMKYVDTGRSDLLGGTFYAHCASRALKNWESHGLQVSNFSVYPSNDGTNTSVPIVAAQSHP
jgi:hypothetical protein